LIEITGLDIALFVMGGLLFSIFSLIAIFSAIENESRARNRSLIIAFSLSAIFVTAAFLDSSPYFIISWALLSLVILSGILFTAPIDKKHKTTPDSPSTRYDERDLVFSRMNLEKGDGKYESYYQNNPKSKTLDDHWRELPPLLSPQTAFFHSFYSTRGREIFDEVDLLYDKVDGDISHVKQNLDIDEITKEVHKYAKRLGANHVAVTNLKDYHLYSTKGRGENYGKEIQRQHEYAIVMTVEMDRTLNKTAPHAPTVYESAKRYLQSGEIAVAVASYIRQLGYSARAHIDANYELLCPLVGRDAGLGEIGRMGILMSPQLGPRMRISVVTTSLGIKPNKRKRDLSMLEFCRYCKKCATNCPANAIPHTDMKQIDGVNRWKINQDSCFSYWKKVGTDCGKCMAVCPYSHPDNSFHRMVKRLIRRNILFRQIAVYMDDFFYGKYPKPYPIEKLPQA
jgi:reductive dehalogenase